MKKLAIGMALAAVCGMVQAETYYLSQNANTITPFTSANLGNYWTNSVGAAPVYGQVSASEDVFWVDKEWGIGVYRRCSPERRYISARLTARRPARSICEM